MMTGADTTAWSYFKTKYRGYINEGKRNTKSIREVTWFYYDLNKVDQKV